MITAWVIVGISIAGIEFMLWTIFRHKVDGLCFPHETDESPLRFFTVTRLRLIAILHTLFLIAIFILSSSLLW